MIEQKQKKKLYWRNNQYYVYYVKGVNNKTLLLFCFISPLLQSTKRRPLRKRPSLLISYGEKIITSSSYQFLQIPVPYSSYNKHGKVLATTNLSGLVSKHGLSHKKA